jgi:hypothetical protein
MIARAGWLTVAVSCAAAAMTSELAATTLGSMPIASAGFVGLKGSSRDGKGADAFA